MNRFACVLALALILAGCNDQSLTILNHEPDAHGPGPSLEPAPWDSDGDGYRDPYDPATTGDIDPYDPGDVDDTSPTEPDYLPCDGVHLEVWNEGVSSARIELNGVELLKPSAFPTREAITLWINPDPGLNVLEIAASIAGSPGDILDFYIAQDDGTRLLHATLVRDTGAPQTLSFETSPSCDF